MTAMTQKWILWQRPKGSNVLWQFRKGRYQSKDAAEDAIKTFATEHPGMQFLALPDGKEPQDNQRSSSMGPG